MIRLFVVYDHPSDFPNHFVIRQWEIDDHGGKPQNEISFSSGNIDVIRGFLRMRGLVNVGKFEFDDPKILEVWL